MFTYILIGAALICAAAILICAFKTKHPVRTILISALSGIAVLSIVSITGAFTGVSLPINGWTVGCSGVAGVPGVLLMLVMRMVWDIR